MDPVNTSIVAISCIFLVELLSKYFVVVPSPSLFLKFVKQFFVDLFTSIGFNLAKFCNNIVLFLQKYIWDIIKDLIINIWTYIKDFIPNLLEFVKNLFRNVLNTFMDLFEPIIGIFVSPFYFMKGYFDYIVEYVKQIDSQYLIYGCTAVVCILTTYIILFVMKKYFPNKYNMLFKVEDNSSKKTKKENKIQK